MKTSNKILLTAAAVAAVVIIASVIATRLMVSNEVYYGGKGEGYESLGKAGEYVSEEFEFEGFREVRFSGGWKAEVRRGDEYSVTLRFPENYRSILDVEREVRVLELGLSRPFDMSGTHLEAEIVMPQLEGIRSLGGIDLELQGFSGEELTMRIDGGSNIKGAGGPFDRVVMKLQGGSNVDLLEMPAENVRVEASGAANVRVDMLGGELTGSIQGAGSVKYTGQVSRQEIETSGVTSVGRLR
jgi:hypothetical protein